MTKTNWKTWLKAAGIRAVKTMAQAGAAAVGSAAIISEVNIPVVFSTMVVAGVLSIFTSIAGLPEVKEG